MAHDWHNQHFLAAWPMLRSDEFTVAYLHSVELSEVKEVYRLSNRQMILTETVFSSYGAGLPATTEYPFEITDDGFRIYQINQVIDPLVYRTGAERADHRLLIGKKVIPFLEFSQAREGVVFTVRYQPLFYYLFKEVLP